MSLTPVCVSARPLTDTGHLYRAVRRVRVGVARNAQESDIRNSQYGLQHLALVLGLTQYDFNWHCETCSVSRQRHPKRQLLIEIPVPRAGSPRCRQKITSTRFVWWLPNIQAKHKTRPSHRDRPRQSVRRQRLPALSHSLNHLGWHAVFVLPFSKCLNDS